MCRFVMYLGEPLAIECLTTRPRHSLIHQSYKAKERREPLNGDGFGVAWYSPDISPRPAVFRSTTPAWNNTNLRELGRVTRSSCILAHVRAATPPLPVTELNCHPFTSGRIALMHNGFIPNFLSVRRKILSELSDEAFGNVYGTTDSECILAMVHDRLKGDDSLESMTRALALTLQRIDALTAEVSPNRAARLNVAMSNGKDAVVSRYCLESEACDSLYIHQGKRYVCREDRCEMVDPVHGRGAVVVASEPLSSDPGWEAIEPNHLVLVAADQTVRSQPLQACLSD
jgi:glutamine amidotransferase